MNGNVVLAGSCHCFTCGYSSNNIAKLIADIYQQDISFGERWLLERYDTAFIEQELNLPEINLSNTNIAYMEESELDKYRYYHPYMYKRKLTNEIIEKFDIGYDKDSNSITFPVRDIKGNLLFITRRNVDKKIFIIPKLVEKPVYLLYNIIHEGYDTIYVCESQINALTMWRYGYPAVALFGTGTDYQYKILASCGIKHFVLCFDGDQAGRKGADRFISNMPSDCLIDIVTVPWNTDINSLEENVVKKLISESKGDIILT